MSTTVLSVRIRRRLKEEAESLGIDIRAVVEKALEDEIRRARLLRIRKLVDKALESMELSAEEWVQAVREARRER